MLVSVQEKIMDTTTDKERVAPFLSTITEIRGHARKYQATDKIWAFVQIYLIQN